MPAAGKAALLDELLRCFDDPARGRRVPGARRRRSRGDAAHVRLARHARPRVRALPHAARRARATHVRRWVSEMIVGMRKFVLLYPNGIRIQTLEEYKEYCYYVAGTVGYLLTDLWHEHAPSIGDARSTACCARSAARSPRRCRR